ncbi:4b0c3180-86f8-48ca-bf56-8441a5373d10-CDS [Sclerotinia trifoliorum]|uniref:non-specific serine/threonine protein kinase n=1 Tax=Sclerotinia trifoliorum TaxID=28548 RepID=A0A8H2W473_9HELO|nr:4b0c3180-86f8-48ca-bf56-8441a5373d10-CDS [Sclerotinia trifoliorum]
MLRRLPNLRQSYTVLSSSFIAQLELIVPILFSPDYPQALTHGDLSVTNILVNEETFEITAIVDWSLATVLPFGIELDILRLTTGYMDSEGWHNYSCPNKLTETFWTEFYALSGAGASLRILAELAAKLGAVLRYGFQRHASGAPTEVVAEETSSFLKGWAADYAHT